MMKKSVLSLIIVSVLALATLTAAAPPPATPNVMITLVSGLPDVMQVGETATVVIEVTSDQPFLYAQALPTAFFPGRGVVGNRGEHVGRGTSTLLNVTFTAKGSTAQFGGPVPVSVVAGVRFAGGYVASQQFDFYVNVP